MKILGKIISAVLILSLLICPETSASSDEPDGSLKRVIEYLGLSGEDKEGYVTNAELELAAEKLAGGRTAFVYEKAEEAAKTEDLIFLMTTALGYPGEDYKKYSGEVTKGVRLSEKYVTREIFGKTLANALTAQRVDLSHFEGKRPVFEKKEALLEARFNIKLVEAVVEADFSAYINVRASLSRDEMLIGNIRAGGKYNTKDYLGRRVRAYVLIDESDETAGELISIEKVKNNETKKTSEVIDGATTSKKLVWLDKERDALKSKEIPKDAIVIYNGKRMGTAAAQAWELFTPGDGEVNLIDNDGDNDVDVVMIWNYNLYIADYVNTEKKSVVCRDFSYGTSIELENKNYFIFDEKGNAAELSDIKQFDVLSVTDTSEENVYVVCSKKEPVEGIYRRSGYSIYIDNDKYSIGNSGLYNFLSFSDGDRVRVYFDMYDRTAYIVALPENEYAFLTKAYPADGEDEPMRLKLYTADGAIAKKETADKVKVIFGDGTENTYYKNKTGENGFSVLYELIENKCGLIRYRENKSGRINRIVFPRTKTDRDLPDTTGGFDIYYADLSSENPDFKEAKYLGGMFVSRYRITSDTLLFSVEGDMRKPEGFKKMSLADLSGDSDYRVMIYDVNDRFETGAAVFAEYTDRYSHPGSIVAEVSPAVGADDEVLTKITLYTNGEENTIYADDTAIESNAEVAKRFGNSGKKLSEIKPGDVIYYKLGANGYVSDFAYFHKNDGGEYYHRSNYGWGDIYIPNCAAAVIYCPIKSVSADMMIIYSDGSLPVMTAERNYYICEKGRVRRADYSDLAPGDRMVGLWRWSALKDVIVYR